MSKIIFIDGRNFLRKISFVLDPNKKQNLDFALYDFKGLLDKILAGISIDKRIFYLGKLLFHLETKQKSSLLIEKQRWLKSHLENQGFEVIITGRVRGHIEKCPMGHEVLTFKEKGVDVKMAVDMITMASAGDLQLAVVASSDSDLQPAIVELRKNNIECFYLGFAHQPNKGLTFTTNKTILIRDSEVKDFWRY